MSPIAPAILVIMVLALLYGTYRVAHADRWVDQIRDYVRRLR